MIQEETSQYYMNDVLEFFYKKKDMTQKQHIQYMKKNKEETPKKFYHMMKKK